MNKLVKNKKMKIGELYYEYSDVNVTDYMLWFNSNDVYKIDGKYYQSEDKRNEITDLKWKRRTYKECMSWWKHIWVSCELYKEYESCDWFHLEFWGSQNGDEVTIRDILYSDMSQKEKDKYRNVLRKKYCPNWCKEKNKICG